MCTLLAREMTNCFFLIFKNQVFNFFRSRESLLPCGIYMHGRMCRRSVTWALLCRACMNLKGKKRRRRTTKMRRNAINSNCRFFVNEFSVRRDSLSICRALARRPRGGGKEMEPCGPLLARGKEAMWLAQPYASRTDTKKKLGGAQCQRRMAI